MMQHISFDGRLPSHERVEPGYARPKVCVQGLGEHAKAIRILDQGLQTVQGERQIQLSYLRGQSFRLQRY